MTKVYRLRVYRTMAERTITAEFNDLAAKEAKAIAAQLTAEGWDTYFVLSDIILESEVI
jgi:hypothetical protein